MSIYNMEFQSGQNWMIHKIIVKQTYTYNNCQTCLEQLSSSSKILLSNSYTQNIVHTLPKTFVSPCTKLLSKTHICYGQNHISLSRANAQPTHQLRMESDNMESKIRNYVITRCGCDLNKVHPAESETQSSCRTKK